MLHSEADLGVYLTLRLARKNRAKTFFPKGRGVKETKITVPAPMVFGILPPGRTQKLIMTLLNPLYWGTFRPVGHKIHVPLHFHQSQGD